MNARFLSVGVLGFSMVGAGLLACGGDDTAATTGDSGADGTTMHPDGGGTDGTTGGDTSADQGTDQSTDQGSDTASVPYVGFVSAVVTPALTMGGANTYGVAAGFAASGTLPSAGCTGTGQVKMGTCCYTPPASGDAGLPDAGEAVTPVNAGTITVTSADGGTLGTLDVDDAGLYKPLSSAMMAWVTWADDDKLGVSAAGGAIKAFMGSLQTSALIAGVTPALSFTMPAMIPIASDLSVKWTPDAPSGEMMQITLSATKATASNGSISCTAMDSDGTAGFTVPTQLLSMFAAGDTGSIFLARASTTTVNAPNATITLIGSTSAFGSVHYQ
jgi:hypothetical protein